METRVRKPSLNYREEYLLNRMLPCSDELHHYCDYCTHRKQCVRLWDSAVSSRISTSGKEDETKWEKAKRDEGKMWGYVDDFFFDIREQRRERIGG